MHIPVLRGEIIRYLQLKKSMVILDCTVGAGGHAEEILKLIGKSGYLIGLDRDKEALNEARLRLKNISDNFKLIHSNYDMVDSIFKEMKHEKIDGALFDLGISSLQMDKAERGFSIKSDGPLDMRMDRSDGVSASNIVNSFTKDELANVFKKYGDEHFAFRIADRIVRERRKARIETTRRLAEIVRETLPYRMRFKKIHPATKVFMALRIAVNREMESLEAGLARTIPFLNKGSRICVISFHSIEDRIVKNKLRGLAESRDVKIITKKPIRPSREEITNNPRSRSAKLRVAERS